MNYPYFEIKLKSNDGYEAIIQGQTEEECLISAKKFKDSCWISKKYESYMRMVTSKRCPTCNQTLYK